MAWGRRTSFQETAQDLAAAAEMRLRRVPEGRAPVFGPMDVLVLEADLVPEVLALHAAGRLPTAPLRPAVVVGLPGGEDPWAAAGALQGIWPQPEVVVLPQGRAWLADHLAGGQAAPDRCPRIGVMGASGGIGTSSVALWLGARLLRDGTPAAVLDAVPASVGLDTCLTPEPVGGLRWEDLAGMARLPEPSQLLGSLPAPHGLPVLASRAGASETVGEASRWAALESFSREVAVVADLGAVQAPEALPAEGGPGVAGAGWVPRCSVLVLLVPFTLRGICQARAAHARWSGVVPIVPVGVGPRICDVSAAEAGAAVGAPLLTVLPHVPAVYEAYETGHLLEAGDRRSLRRPVSELAEAVLRLAARDEAGSGTRRVPTTERTRPPRSSATRAADGASRPAGAAAALVGASS